MKILSGSDITKVDLDFSDRQNVIIHCCNDIPVMGSGVARALFEKWPSVKTEYMADPKSKELGHVGFVNVAPHVVVANVIGQHNIKSHDQTTPPVRYEALKKGVQETLWANLDADMAFHIPYLMGCDLAGGDWFIVSAMLEKIFQDTRAAEDRECLFYHDLFYKSKV